MSGLPLRIERWTAKRKAAVIEAIDAGELSAALAMRRYGLTADELRVWRVALGLRGVKGLRVVARPGRREG